MKKHKKIYLILGIVLLICLVAFGVYYFYFRGEVYTGPLEECKTLEYNGEGKIDIVFFGDEETSKRYFNYLMKVVPFSENKESFNAFFIDDYFPECEIYQGVAVLCYSKELLKKSSSCPNDYVVVLHDFDEEIRSSAYMNVMSLNFNHPFSVFVHEFGHAFANLAEEYIPAKLPRGAKNCVGKCENFDGETEGCFIECSRGDYYRSIENGVMRTLSSSRYGIYNENLIEEIIDDKLGEGLTGRVVSLFEDCRKEEYYLIEISDGKVKKSLESGCVGGNGIGDSDYSLFDDSGNLVLSEKFNSDFIFTDSPGEEVIKGETYSDGGVLILLKIPVIEGAKKLEIVKSDGARFDIDLNDAVDNRYFGDISLSPAYSGNKEADLFEPYRKALGLPEIK